MQRFTGKVAIVTGAASGIGRATALRLAEEGAAVTVADLDGDRGAGVVGEIEAAGGSARLQVVDVAEPDDVRAMVSDTVAAYERLDVLHNNAAALDQNRLDQDVVTGATEVWDRVFAVNLTGPRLAMRAAIPVMLEQGGGVVVNTVSAAAFYGSTGLAAYGTSKAALLALTRYVATAYGERGIRCNAVAPGVVVEREMQEQLGPMGDRLRRYTTSHLTGRLGYPEDVAAAVAYLASDDAAFVTGEVLRVDGGFTAHSPTHATDREIEQ